MNLVADRIVFGNAPNVVPNSNAASTLARQIYGFSTVNLKAGEISANLRLGGQSELTAGFREAVATVAAADLNASYRRQQAQWSIFVGASTGLHQAF